MIHCEAVAVGKSIVSLSHFNESSLMPQGCAVVVEANQLESGQKAHINVTGAQSGCFLQPEVMEVGQTQSACASQ